MPCTPWRAAGAATLGILSEEHVPSAQEAVLNVSCQNRVHADIGEDVGNGLLWGSTDAGRRSHSG